MNKRITARILKKAIKLLEHGWCQGHYAETKDGILCNESSEDAVRFCAVGSLIRSTTNFNGDQYTDARFHIMKYVPKGESLTGFNDRSHTKQADVIKVFKRALRPLVNS